MVTVSEVSLGKICIKGPHEESEQRMKYDAKGRREEDVREREREAKVWMSTLGKGQVNPESA